ncbi:hypothetical protein KKC17_04495 [Patescibacteria group bacterium]|nr:hypothetical protein [Patescibacteria group bacterium]
MFLFNYCNNKKNIAGQGLLEVTMAIGIILFGLLGIMSLTTASFGAAAEAEDRLLATNLAREGIEAVRSLRDDSWLQGSSNSWYGQLASAGDLTVIPVLDPVTFEWSFDFTANNLEEAVSVVWRDQNSLFRQSSTVITGSPTFYSRLLTIYAICREAIGGIEISSTGSCQTGYNQIGVRVVSQVRWSRHGSHVITLENFLYNWRYSYDNYAP